MATQLSMFIGLVLISLNAFAQPATQTKAEAQCSENEVRDAFFVRMEVFPDVLRVDVAKAATFARLDKLKEMRGLDMTSADVRRRYACPNAPLLLRDFHELHGFFGGIFSIDLPSIGSVEVTWQPTLSKSEPYALERMKHQCVGNRFVATKKLAYCMDQQPLHAYNAPELTKIPTYQTGVFYFLRPISEPRPGIVLAGRCSLGLWVKDYCQTGYLLSGHLGVLFSFRQNGQALDRLEYLPEISSSVLAKMPLSVESTR